MKCKVSKITARALFTVTSFIDNVKNEMDYLKKAKKLKKNRDKKEV